MKKTLGKRRHEIQISQRKHTSLKRYQDSKLETAHGVQRIGKEVAFYFFFIHRIPGGEALGCQRTLRFFFVFYIYIFAYFALGDEKDGIEWRETFITYLRQDGYEIRCVGFI